MATALKKGSEPSPGPSSRQDSGPSAILGKFLGIFSALYRFFASLKLAVISLATLASVLGYATFFESWYGGAAAQEWIYQSRGFAILLAFLGANILCAALIRYPWKKRQTGFVVTHAGLLILLVGSFLSVRKADEGQVGAVEKETKNELVRVDFPVIRVTPVEAHSADAERMEYRLPFRPGNFGWGPGNPRPRGVFDSIYHALTFGKFDHSAEPVVLSGRDDPFVFKVKSHLPASIFAFSHVADPAGIPMLKLRPKFKPPNAPQANDVFDSEDERWFAPTRDTDVNLFRHLYRQAKNHGPAQFAFLYVDRPELVADFLDPPKVTGPAGVARIRYEDKAGKTRSYDWTLEGQQEKSVTLPDSDLTVTFAELIDVPLPAERILEAPGVAMANFKVRKGDGPEVVHHGWASLPMMPNIIPSQDGSSKAKPLVSINYVVAPEVDPATNGRFGVVEILGTPDGSLYYRVFGRGAKGLGELSESGKLTKGKEIVARFSKSKQAMPMQLTFEVEEYLTGGRSEEVCEPLVLPKGQQGNGLAASLVEMTVKDKDKSHTKEFWIRRSAAEPVPQRVSFPSGDYEVVYDVDRKPLGFSLTLDDFKVEFDPGTNQPASFVSKVRLTDASQGIKDRPITISMNQPLSHRGYTFYQANYRPMTDPQTGQETGQFQSIFQVGIDPGRMTKYLGCFLVVAGAFVQFYMRAGLFSDGGKREKEMELRKARRQAEGVDEAEESL